MQDKICLNHPHMPIHNSWIKANAPIQGSFLLWSGVRETQSPGSMDDNVQSPCLGVQLTLTLLHLFLKNVYRPSHSLSISR